VGDEVLLSELYGSWINDHYWPEQDPEHQDLVANYLESRDAHEIVAAADFLGVARDQMVTLDYGMGWALWAKIAAKLGCDSHGSDLSSVRMEYARGHGVKTIDADQIGGPQFHFINLEQVMEHLARPREVAERLAAALLPNGILKISVPSGERVDAIVQKLLRGRSSGTRDDLMPVQPLEHVNTYTTKSLKRLAEALSLRLVQPSLLQRYAFLRTPGAVRPKHFRRAARELLRPLVQFRNPRNLYVWLQKPA
jgi:hypothetical protein